MRKLDIGQTVGILANLGVLVGILLLAYELNQTRELTRAQTRNELNQSLISIMLDLADDAETASLIDRGDNGEALSDTERVRYIGLTIPQLRYHENVYYQYRNGLYDEVEYRAQREGWRNRVFQSPGIVAVFCAGRSGFSRAFVSEIEGLLTTYTCE
jgi:hypothetical protein